MGDKKSSKGNSRQGGRNAGNNNNNNNNQNQNTNQNQNNNNYFTQPTGIIGIGGGSYPVPPRPVVPDDKSCVFDTSVVLEVDSNDIGQFTSTQIRLLELGFRETYNELNVDFCDPLQRRVMDVQVSQADRSFNGVYNLIFCVKVYSTDCEAGDTTLFSGAGFKTPLDLGNEWFPNHRHEHRSVSHGSPRQ